MAVRAFARAELGKRNEKPCTEGKKRRPCRKHECMTGQQQTQKYGGKAERSNQTAPQGIKELKPLNIGHGGIAAEYPAGVLPISADPAVTAPIVGDGGGGEGIRKLGVAHITAAQVRTLERIVRKHKSVGNVCV